ncbi:TPA: hypothetical protein N0F65_009173, partial [Lagenidium giganteum]
RLLAISPLEDGQTADAHIEYTKTISGVYHKKIAMVRFLVADNCSTNQRLARKLEIPMQEKPQMVECALFDVCSLLAVNLNLEEYMDLVNQIKNLMVHLRHHKNASQLAKAANLGAIKSNSRRWSSILNMVRLYVEFREEVLTVSDVKDLVPRDNAHRRIKTLADRLKDLDSRTERSRSTRSWRVKIQNNVTLTSEEEDAVKNSRTPVTPAAVVCTKKQDFATTILRQAKRPRRYERASSEYASLVQLVPPTSNHCKRLFSGCKLVLTSLRSSLLPANF